MVLIEKWLIVLTFGVFLLQRFGTMAAEMQEIAITEEKPLLTGQADAKVRVTHKH